VVQFLHTTGRTGELWVEGGPDQHAAQIYFDQGNVYHAQESTAVGLDALVQIISWVDGTFIFSTDKQVPTVTIDAPLPNVLVEAARLLDEQRRAQQEQDDRDAPQRLLASFADSADVLGAILIARDGSPIAAASPEDRIDLAGLNDHLGDLIGAIDRLGEGQDCSPFGGFFLEFDRLQLLCKPVADVLLVVIAPGRSQLGVIRHKTQHLADSLADVLES
jgi:predicted regulator of Ras-like GTPase activity (Roadblock/LC7/MglB family)